MNEPSTDKFHHLWEVPGPSADERYKHQLRGIEIRLSLLRERECLREAARAFIFIVFFVMVAFAALLSPTSFEIKKLMGVILVVLAVFPMSGLIWYGFTNWSEANDQRKRRETLQENRTIIDV